MQDCIEFLDVAMGLWISMPSRNEKSPRFGIRNVPLCCDLSPNSPIVRGHIWARLFEWFFCSHAIMCFCFQDRLGYCQQISSPDTHPWHAQVNQNCRRIDLQKCGNQQSNWPRVGNLRPKILVQSRTDLP